MRLTGSIGDDITYIDIIRDVPVVLGDQSDSKHNMLG